MGLPLPIRVLRCFGNPGWGFQWLAEFLGERSTAHRHKGRISEYYRYRMDLDAAIVRITSRSLSEVEDFLSRGPFSENMAARIGNGRARWAGSPELASLCYVVCRLVRPAVVVETGVGSGISSWSFLAAMHQNQLGALYSIDLPIPNSMQLPGVGHLVPPELKSKWVLTLGPSAKVMPRIFSEVGPVDMFLHDSRHSYTNQMMEYRLAWQNLRPGGVLISDDVSNNALLEMAECQNVEPFIVGQSKPYPIGILVKPGD